MISSFLAKRDDGAVDTPALPVALKKPCLLPASPCFDDLTRCDSSFVMVSPRFRSFLERRPTDNVGALRLFGVW